MEEIYYEDLVPIAVLDSRDILFTMPEFINDDPMQPTFCMRVFCDNTMCICFGIYERFSKFAPFEEVENTPILNNFYRDRISKTFSGYAIFNMMQKYAKESKIFRNLENKWDYQFSKEIKLNRSAPDIDEDGLIDNFKPKQINKLEDLVPIGRCEEEDILFLVVNGSAEAIKNIPEPVLGIYVNLSEDAMFCSFDIYQTMESFYDIKPIKQDKKTIKKHLDRIRQKCTLEALEFIIRRFNEELNYLEDLDNPWAYEGSDAIPLNEEEYSYFRVTTLCGSTRFKQEFLDIQKKLTLEGRIVISVGLFGHSGDNEVWTEGTKEMLDRMHKKKIDMADSIFVINKNGYIGESTRSEIEYAKEHGKRIEYLEPNEY